MRNGAKGSLVVPVVTERWSSTLHQKRSTTELNDARCRCPEVNKLPSVAEGRRPVNIRAGDRRDPDVAQWSVGVGIMRGGLSLAGHL